MGQRIRDSILSADHTANRAVPNIGSLASQLMTVLSTVVQYDYTLEETLVHPHSPGPGPGALARALTECST